MAKVLTVTLNPAIDITVQIDTLKVGHVNRQQSAQSLAAGKGLNVAQVLKDLGHDPIITGFLGQSNREIFDQHFRVTSVSRIHEYSRLICKKLRATMVSKRVVPIHL